MRNGFIALIAISSASCGAEDACRGYQDAYYACGDEFNGGDTFWRAGEVDGCSDELRDLSAGQYGCKKDAFSSADCTTSEGYEGAKSAALDCE